MISGGSSYTAPSTSGAVGYSPPAPRASTVSAVAPVVHHPVAVHPVTTTTPSGVKATPLNKASPVLPTTPDSTTANKPTSPSAPPVAKDPVVLSATPVTTPVTGATTDPSSLAMATDPSSLAGGAPSGSFLPTSIAAPAVVTSLAKSRPALSESLSAPSILNMAPTSLVTTIDLTGDHDGVTPPPVTTSPAKAKAASAGAKAGSPSVEVIEDKVFIHEAGGGGDCLFHSLAHQLNTKRPDLKPVGEGRWDHSNVRAKIVEYMRSDNDFLDSDSIGGLGTPKRNAYIAKMAREREWGTTLEIAVAKAAFGVQIEICTPFDTTYCRGGSCIVAAQSMPHECLQQNQREWIPEGQGEWWWNPDDDVELSRRVPRLQQGGRSVDRVLPKLAVPKSTCPSSGT